MKLQVQGVTTLLEVFDNREAARARSSAAEWWSSPSGNP